jgi:hypothetical protein
MQVQTSPQTEDERLALGATPEASPNAIEQPPATNVVELSGLAQDKLALKEVPLEDVTTADGKIFKTLRIPASEKAGPMPTQAQVETNAEDKDKIVKELERIMSADLAQIDPKTKQLTGLFTELPADRQTLLKQEGERIARNIDDMFKTRKIDLQEIHNDIEQWLRIIPMINRPWLEQQATIITDKTSNMYQEYIRDINPN